jgi:hypothetical protein
LHQSEDGVDLAMIETTFNALTIIYKFLSLQAKRQPRFDAKAWLPFKMAQGTMEWSINKK